MMNDILAVVFVLAVLAAVSGIFIRLCVKIRRGGGSLTTIVLGASDGFLTHERSKAAEAIVDENAGKKFEQLPPAETQKK